MNAAAALTARLGALDAQCDEVAKAINSKSIHPALYKRAAADLFNRITGARERIAGYAHAASWGSVGDCEKECSILFGECLAFLQAGRARGHDVDADLCEIADALLDELAKASLIDWSRFTVLATEEYFLDVAQIIRLRFPFAGVWDLPVAAHEFGHFVAGRLNLSRPDGSHRLAFQDYKIGFKAQNPDWGAEWMYYLEEYFADVFAVFTIGPAYAYTCILLRFDPASAQTQQDRRHPSYSRRAWAILRTLNRMNMEQDSKGHFKATTDLLTKFWDEAIESAGQKAPIPDETLIDGLVSAFYEMFKQGCPNARFNRWNLVLAAYRQLEEANPNFDAAKPLNISDLLNAAWLCRLRQGADTARISNNLIRLCRSRLGIAP